MSKRQRVRRSRPSLSVSSRISAAKRDEYKLAVLVAVISIAISLFGGVRGYPAGLKAALALAYLVSTFVGVRLGIAKDAHGA